MSGPLSFTDEDGTRSYTCPECLTAHDGYHVCPVDLKLKPAPKRTLDTYKAGYKVGMYVGVVKGGAVCLLIGAVIVLALWKL